MFQNSQANCDYDIYHTAYQYIDSDSTFLDYRINVSCEMAESNYLLFYFTLIKDKQIKTNSDKILFYNLLLNLDKTNNDNKHLTCFPFVNELNRIGYKTDKQSNCNMKFSKVFINNGYNELFVEVWTNGNIKTGGEYYLYLFVFDENGHIEKTYKENFYCN